VSGSGAAEAPWGPGAAGDVIRASLASLCSRRMSKARAAALASLLLAGLAAPQNSTRKIRTEPSATAAAAGAAVRWRTDLDAALAEARETERPVFWYVPTVRGSRMDRKPEIDRYMMGGPFSWPGLVGLLNDAFIPVRQPGGSDDAERFGLRPIEFVEPGFLVVGADGEVQATVDEITTLDPGFFLTRLGEALDGRSAEALERAQAWFETLVEAGGAADRAKTPEERFVAGARAFWAGEDAASTEIWSALAAEDPDSSPWVAKAALEVEGHGPIVHGFEVPWARLRQEALRGGRGTRAAAGVFDEAALGESGLAYFVAMQRGDGGFRDSIYDFGGTDSLPNVHVAITALAAWAMLEVMERTPGEERAADKCFARAVKYAFDDRHLNTDDQDELIWAYLYRARLAARWLALRPADADQVRPLLARTVADLARMQPEDGAWFHEYANPFVISACLLALSEARKVGAVIPDGVGDRGVLALLRCRAEDGAITYGMPRRGRVRAQVQGGVGRMPLAEAALADWGHAEDGALARAVDASFEFHDELDQVRKYDDHASRYGYGGFFFWFDLHARIDAIARLGDGEAQQKARAAQRAQILALPEIDGCFVDSHEIGRVYGTAMALICLAAIAD
jgi:hypothetical protein